jgi:hypothetical protein
MPRKIAKYSRGKSNFIGHKRHSDDNSTYSFDGGIHAETPTHMKTAELNQITVTGNLVPEKHQPTCR